MTEGTSQPGGPDLSNGLDLAQLADGAMLLGHVGPEAVLLARRGEEVFAIGATCTHYGGPLSEGLLVGGYCSVPVASRLLQPAHRRGDSATGT